MADRPPPPPGFTIVPASPPAGHAPTQPEGFTLLPTGEVHDGDTFRLNTGQNARLYGVDAFELDQQGMFTDGQHPIGRSARDALLHYVQSDGTVNPTGTSTWGRPVVSLTTDGQDAGRGILDQGYGLATPQYLRNDPARFVDYMEAERLARLNRRGAHAGQFQSPEDFRAGEPDPWAKPQGAPDGKGEVIFVDEPTPFQGLRPEIADGYIRIWQDPRSTPEDLLAFAKTNGFSIDPEKTRKAYERRNSTRTATPTITYEQPPRLLTDPGDGTLGALARGVGDPLNMIDEAGGVIDAIGGTPGRENVWNSDRRFGDILWNNIDQNRGIIGHDDFSHPYARLGGQVASGLVLPGVSFEGVGLAAARNVLRAGGSRLAAEEATKAAVRSRLGAAGAVEGGLIGFGDGEGDVVDRLPSAGIGAAAGGALGFGTAAVAQALGGVYIQEQHLSAATRLRKPA